ncbi:sugar transferase [Microbacterium sp. AZCO]|uniref:sugar transferase n=1 Tax=Microbacterium sp. AZCO TaxID=3142976 RepID=UPI0031F44E83
MGPTLGMRAGALEQKATLKAPPLRHALERRRLWERRYARRLLWSDTLVIVLAAGLADVAALATGATPRDARWAVAEPLLIAAVWLAMMAALHTREPSIAGSGATEYKRVANASGVAFGLIAVAWAVLQVPPVRMQLLVALPVGLAALIITRHSWRRWLNAQRRLGRWAARAIVTGTRADVEYVIRMLQRQEVRSHVVLGAAIVDCCDDELLVDGRRYPVVGTPDSVAEDARQLGADSVVVASRPDDDPDFIKRLSWRLEGTAAELILSSSLTDVAGPRITLEPLDGLPLIHVKIPEFEGGRHALKRVMDVVVSALALVGIALILPVIALLIAADDGGPVFFRQVRVGRDGREFHMLKFRTMVPDAEAKLAALTAANEGSGLLFKLHNDPRVTRVGAVLRRYSLDELPQFWNVLRGDMSVVGPRPPLPSEVNSYDGAVCRRLFIKPGITGLWQISGRSDLTWDESVRLDLLYVENWSAMSDLMIMWRTAHIMIRPKGAY